MNSKDKLRDLKFELFRRELLHPKREVRVLVSNSLGLSDAYAWCSNKELLRLLISKKGNMINVNRSTFGKIITKVNEILAKHVALGDTVKFPYGMGTLEALKKKKYAKFKNGKLIANYPINWVKTHKLWYEDPKARASKLIIRDLVPFTYRIFYNSKKARVKNLILYSFKVNRFLHIKTKNNFNNGITDTKEFVYGEYKY